MYIVPAWSQVERRRASHLSLSYPRPPQRSGDKTTPPKMSHVTELHGAGWPLKCGSFIDSVHFNTHNYKLYWQLFSKDCI